MTAPSMTMDAFGDGVLEEIKGRVSKEQFGSWFERASFRQTADGVEVSVPSRFHRNYLKERYLPLLEDAISTVLGEVVGKLVFVVDESTGPLAAQLRPQVVSKVARSPVIPLKHDYTFDEFITGPSNDLAHAAALSVAEQPGVAYNPYFLHGSVGLGKTHLLQAVAHRLLEAGLKRILYVSCASFTNEFIAALAHGDVDSFRDRYRRADALLIDDIHFLASKERTQEEFFHTFNAVYNEQKQIILTSDSQPNDIVGLGERLVSRFRLGLVVQIQPPCLETRIAIVLRKGQRRELEIPLDVAELVAKRVHSNIRELEGAVLRLDSLVRHEGLPLNIENAGRTLTDLLGDEPARIDIDQIEAAVELEFGVTRVEMRSSRRSRSVVFPRQVCMFLARKYTRHSLGEIGLHFGGRDHTTVLHSVDKIRKQLPGDSRLRNSIERVEKQLLGR